MIGLLESDKIGEALQFDPHYRGFNPVLQTSIRSQE